MFGKIVNGNLVIAPNPIIINGNLVGNPPDDVYAAQGYKRIISVQKPEQTQPGFYWSETWTELGNSIQQGWELLERSELTADEALGIILGGDGNDA